jgi:hypothetical protein
MMEPMAEPVNWRRKYRLLGDFIAAHPEIVLKKAEVSIPQNLREEFYSHFDRVRRAVVEDRYSTLPVDVEALCDNFIRIEKEVVELLRLNSISMPTDLSIFLHNPKEGLIRVLYNRLFDVLQGKLSLDDFEEQSASDLKAAAAVLFRLGYEWWASLALIKLLDPDEAFRVDFDDEFKLVLREIREISFGRQAHHPTMRIPEFVIRSRRLGKYVAIKMALAREIETFVVTIKPPVRPRKKTGDTSLALDSRVMLLFFMPSIDKIPVVADIYECTLTSPSWMVEYVTGNELNDAMAMEDVENRLNALKPELGTCLVLIDAEDEAGLAQIQGNICPVAAGFDQAKLQAVVDGLPQEA